MATDDTRYTDLVELGGVDPNVMLTHHYQIIVMSFILSETQRR